jgi:hypothetical protein
MKVARGFRSSHLQEGSISEDPRFRATLGDVPTIGEFVFSLPHVDVDNSGRTWNSPMTASVMTEPISWCDIDETSGRKRRGTAVGNGRQSLWAGTVPARGRRRLR